MSLHFRCNKILTEIDISDSFLMLWSCFISLRSHRDTAFWPLENVIQFLQEYVLAPEYTRVSGTPSWSSECALSHWSLSSWQSELILEWGSKRRSFVRSHLQLSWQYNIHSVINGTQPVVTQHAWQHSLHLQHGELLSYTVPGTGAEGDVSVGVSLCYPFWQEIFRVKFFKGWEIDCGSDWRIN